MSGQGVEKYFFHTKNKVGNGWRDLAGFLKFTTPDIDSIQTQYWNDKERCLGLLQQWHTRDGNGASIHVLMEALAEAELQSVVDYLKTKYPELAEKPPEVPKQEPPAAAPTSRVASVTPGTGAAPTRRDLKAVEVSSQVLMRHKGPGVPVVLLVNDEYGTSKGGISTINCHVGQTLVAAGAVVYATALRVPKQDQEAADRDGVKLIPPHLPGKKTEPTLDWLTDYHSVHYPNLPQDVTCIIGHADITDTAARNIWEQRFLHADLITITHVIPEDTEYYKGGRKAMKAWEKEKDMLAKVHNAKAAFSVGKRIYDHFDTKYKGNEKPKSHHLLLPKPSDTFLANNVRPGGEQKSVLSVGRVRKAEKQKGHDLAAQSMRDVIRRIPNVLWGVRGISEDDYEVSMQILRDNLDCGDLNPTLRCYGTQEDILYDMMTAHLVLMPSRSEPFGLVGLEAMAAGIPVLISDKTGLAWMIKELIKQKKIGAEHRHVIVETSVNDNDTTGDAKRWADKIVGILTYSDEEFEKAARLKRQLVESKYWEDSQRTFLKACGIRDDQ